METQRSANTLSASLTPGVDLRRRRRRELIERLLARAEWLDPEDKAIMHCVYEDGRSVAEVARLRRDDAYRLRRRVRRLVRRLMSPRFVFVVSHKASWTPSMRRVGEACVLHGLSIRRASQALTLTHHTVRRHLSAINALFEAAS